MFLVVDDDEQECPTESLIAKGVLGDICGEAAKLKTMGVMNQVLTEYLQLWLWKILLSWETLLVTTNLLHGNLMF